MKRTMLQLHKEAILLCEKRMTNVKAQSALLISWTFEYVMMMKLQTIFFYKVQTLHKLWTRYHNVE